MSLVVFAISFGFLANFNFGANSENLANAENGNFTKNSQNPENKNLQKSMQNSANETSENYTVEKLDFINFDRKSYIDTKVFQTDATKIVVDFEFNNLTFTEVAQRVFGAAGNGDAQQIGFGISDNPNLADDEKQWFARFNAGGGFQYFGKNDVAQHVFKIDNGKYFLDENFVGNNGGTRPNALPVSIFLGATTNAQNAGGAFFYDGKIYNFQIFVGKCSDSTLREKTDCENSGETWREDLALNLVPAAKYFGCGENFVVEYGFANDLDDDGNLVNDEFFGNDGIGVLTGSEEISAGKCPEKPTDNPDENNENPPTETTLPITKPENILPPNTGKL